MSIAGCRWQDVAAVMARLEIRAELEQISSDAIVSFRVGRGGFARLKRRKELTKAKLEENLARICIYVGANRTSMTNDELEVARTLYRTIAASIECVGDHVDRAWELEQIEQRSLGRAKELEDELPF